MKEREMYGRDEQEWDQLVQAGLEFLLERAKARRTTSYTELNAVLRRRTRLREFNFSHAEERAAMGHLLGRIVARDQEQYPRQMISAIVIYLNENDAGSGFYQLAQNLDLLAGNPSADQKLRFWSEQMKAIYSRYDK
jgi:hypothetical protein